MAHAILGENALKLEEAFGWVLEAGLRVRARMHLVYELGGLDPVPGYKQSNWTLLVSITFLLKLGKILALVELERKRPW
jgi:hypothetical protein